jgi:hypothetical protein
MVNILCVHRKESILHRRVAKDVVGIVYKMVEFESIGFDE